MKWKPIETAKKDVMIPVLLCSTGHVQEGYWDEGKWYSAYGPELSPQPKFWMPLPAPPDTQRTEPTQ